MGFDFYDAYTYLCMFYSFLISKIVLKNFEGGVKKDLHFNVSKLIYRCNKFKMH